MSKLIPVAAVTALALIAAAPAPARTAASVAPERAARQCFLPQTVVNFRTAEDTTAYVRAGRGEVYQLQSGGCRGLTASRSLTIVSRSGGGACVGETVGLNTAGPSLTNENYTACSARIVKRLTPEEVAALPARLRP